MSNSSPVYVPIIIMILTACFSAINGLPYDAQLDYTYFIWINLQHVISSVVLMSTVVVFVGHQPN